MLMAYATLTDGDEETAVALGYWAATYLSLGPSHGDKPSTVQRRLQWRITRDNDRRAAPYGALTTPFEIVRGRALRRATSGPAGARGHPAATGRGWAWAVYVARRAQKGRSSQRVSRPYQAARPLR